MYAKHLIASSAYSLRMLLGLICTINLVIDSRCWKLQIFCQTLAMAATMLMFNKSTSSLHSVPHQFQFVVQLAQKVLAIHPIICCLVIVSFTSYL